MFPVGSGIPQHSLPTGWTAYTDPSTSRTYYVHLPTGDTQWTRPPPPPPPPPPPHQLNPAPPPPLPAPMAQTYNSSPHYVTTPSTPRGVQCYPQYCSSQGTLSNGSAQDYNQNFNQINLPPPTLSNTYDPHWHPKRIRPPSHYNTEFNSHIPPTKRPRVLQHASPETRRKCSKCGLVRAWELFSKRQWLNSISVRKCKVCVDETVAANELFHQSTTTNPSSTTITETERTNVCPNQSKPESTTETKRKKCSKCGLVRAWEFFSKRQWLASEALRKCKECVDETVAANELLSQQQSTTTNPSTSTTMTEKETRTKVCSACGEHLVWGSFSKRQWTSQNDVRKCQLCMDKWVEESDRRAKQAATDAKQATADAKESSSTANDESPQSEQPPVNEASEGTAVCTKENEALMYANNNLGGSFQATTDEETESANENSITPASDVVVSKDLQLLIKNDSSGSNGDSNSCVMHPILKVKGEPTTDDEEVVIKQEVE